MALVRAWRTGRSTPGRVHGLADEIGGAIESYLVRHPGSPSEQGRTALWYVALHFTEDGSGGDVDPEEACK